MVPPKLKTVRKSSGYISMPQRKWTNDCQACEGPEPRTRDKATDLKRLLCSSVRSARRLPWEEETMVGLMQTCRTENMERFVREVRGQRHEKVTLSVLW